jgi:hypothetical protein
MDIVIIGLLLGGKRRDPDCRRLQHLLVLRWH